MTKNIPQALRDFDSLPDSAGVRLEVVSRLVGVVPNTVWRWSKTGKLPAPIKMGGICIWNVGALRRNMQAAMEVA